MSRAAKLYLGCPVWACEHWKGSLYTARAPRTAWLEQYSSVFSTVEGNSTFYALPNLDTAKRWGESVKPGFQFSLKVSRSISHDRRLRGAQSELDEFCAVARAIAAAGSLGPSFLQLPPDFSPREATALETFVAALPDDLPWAVEVRHHDWYDAGRHEQWLTALLQERGIDTVLFDSRPLYSKPPSDEVERVSQQRKPKTPLRTTVTGSHPFLRIVGRNNLDEVEPWIEEWAPTVAHWLEQDLEPFLFTHAPDDRFAPEFGRRMHAAVQRYFPDLAPLPDWLGEVERKNGEAQMMLF